MILSPTAITITYFTQRFLLEEVRIYFCVPLFFNRFNLIYSIELILREKLP